MTDETKPYREPSTKTSRHSWKPSPRWGKSYGVVKWAETTSKPLTLITSRHELYGQYEKWCEERELSYLSLPAFHRECPTLGGENSIEGDVRRLYEAGIFGKELHENSTAYFGQRLPCQLDDPCPYMEKRDFDPSEYDVLIGHYLHEVQYRPSGLACRRSGRTRGS